MHGRSPGILVVEDEPQLCVSVRKAGGLILPSRDAMPGPVPA